MPTRILVGNLTQIAMQVPVRNSIKGENIREPGCNILEIAPYEQTLGGVAWELSRRAKSLASRSQWMFCVNLACVDFLQPRARMVSEDWITTSDIQFLLIDSGTHTVNLVLK